jgi:energy-coupling factor transporter ATP-binding protein EcfA2
MLSLDKSKNSKHIAIVYKNKKHIEDIYLNDNIRSMNKDFETLMDEYEIYKMNLNKTQLKEVKRQFEKEMNKQKSISFPEDENYEVNKFISDEPERLFLVGPSGSGKSTLIGKYIRLYKGKFNKGKIILFSDKPFDKELDKKENKLIRIKLDDKIVNDPIQADELANSLVIFDDIDSIQDKNIKSAIYSLKDQILKRGRSLSIYCITTSHQNEFQKTRPDFNESTGIFLFPDGGNRSTVNYILEHYMGMNTKEIKKLCGLGSRWIYINKTYPNYVIYDLGVLLL